MYSGAEQGFGRSLLALLFASPVSVPAWRLATRRGNRWGRVLHYHNVPDSAVASFEIQLRYLTSHYTIVSLEEMVRRVREGPMDGQCVALAFDDGYLDNYANAFPVLRQYGVPATFFVSTGFIDGSGKSDAEAQFSAQRLGVASSHAMSWDHLKEMLNCGCSVGSHTRKHTRLVGLGEEELMEEVTTSKQQIEDVLGAPCLHLAYPFGTSNDIDDLAVQSIRNAGYEACFSGVRGFNLPFPGRFLFYRDHIAASWSPSVLRLVVEGGLDFRYRKPRSRLAQMDAASS